MSTQTVAESIVNLGITAESIAESVSDHVAHLLDAGVWPEAIRMRVREMTKKELQWLDRLVKEAVAVTLTDAEREAVGRMLRRWREDYYGRLEGAEQVGAIVDGLLARAAKEVTP